MFLSDQQLVPLAPKIIKGLDLSGDPYAANSKVQPASIDLTIGDIFLPEMNEGEKGSIEYPFHSYSLRSGHTAIVQTKEVLDLPADLAAIGFPPSRVSSKGLLMTNPGHVDPGYKGRMKFTVINMGRESFPLKTDDFIVTLLFFTLNPPAEKSYSDRNQNIQGNVGEEELSRLGRDFLDVERRATHIARKYATVAIGVPILVAAITVWGTSNSAKHYAERRITEVEKILVENKASLDNDITNIKNKVGDLNLEKRIEQIERFIERETAGSPKQ